MRTSRRLGATLAFALLLGASVAAPAAAATPPFPEPAEWSTICDTKRSAGTALGRGTNCRWLRVDGHPRRYLVYVPGNGAFPIGRSWPVVFMFHGSSGTGEKFHRISGWKELAERKGFIVVFPTAIRYQVIGGGRVTKWNHFELEDEVDLSVRLDGYPATAPFPARDVTFVDRMLADIGTALRVNVRNLHIAGFSNGGQFAARLAVQRSRVYASGAWTGGGIGVVKDPARNMPVLLGIGTLDDRVIDGYNAAQDPDITEVPLPWLEATGVVGQFVGGHVATFGLRPGAAFQDVTETPTFTRVAFDTPFASEDDGQVLRFLLMGEVTHQYPRTGNNPHGFTFAAQSWVFFRQHPMP